MRTKSNRLSRVQRVCGEFRPLRRQRIGEQDGNERGGDRSWHRADATACATDVGVSTPAEPRRRC